MSSLPNAPKKQTCDVCGAQAKRVAKTQSTAKYQCRNGHTMIISLPGVHIISRGGSSDTTRRLPR